MEIPRESKNCNQYGSSLRGIVKWFKERSKAFPHKYQIDANDCGPTCLFMIARYYGQKYSINYYREKSGINREGVSMLRLKDAAENLGFHTICAKITLPQLNDDILLPCILHWKNNHYVVCYAIKGQGVKRKYYIADPSLGKRVVREDELRQNWLAGTFEDEPIGIALQLEPSEEFAQIAVAKEEKTSNILYNFWPHILPHKWKIIQMLVGTIIIMGMNYMLPLISQMVVDIGVLHRDLAFIMLMMGIQLGISLFTISIQFVQSWLALNMHTIINIKLIANYLSKLSKMPLQFFERRTLGDILQRIGDHDRIKGFLMGDLISILFSGTTFITFSIILFVYNWIIFSIFFAGSALHVVWILAFMKYRREIDHRMFEQSSLLQNNLVQFVQGMQEIKINNIEQQKRWEWERIQAKVYNISVRALRIGQVQSAGSFFFSTITNIAISYLTAKMVITGELTLGMMVSLTFIIGQVAAPIGSFIGFAQSYQDAKISLERLSDLYTQKDEYEDEVNLIKEAPEGNLQLDNISYSYSGHERDNVLHNISIIIPQGKTTAIVGASGCGKTTLVKLMQGFYLPQKGKVYVGDRELDQINKSVWRANLGAVMQDGFIFSDSIANNIAVGEKDFDKERLAHAMNVANLSDFVESLPLNYDTKIGAEGMGLSQGQKQRVLIARSVYKNPSYIFLDEATNALDSKNEREILQQVKAFYADKTMVVVAHRLSTIRNADKIIVMKEGNIVGEGTHETLLSTCQEYIELVNNQIDKMDDE